MYQTVDDATDEKQCFVFTEFKHYDQVMDLISSIKTEVLDPNKEESLEETLIKIFSLYQEQPHLLDPYLEKMISACLDAVHCSTSEPKVFHFAFKILYLMTRTRGHKAIIRLMPHTVDDIEPNLCLLMEQDINSTENWQTRYVLLLWLSVLVMVPFSLDRLDCPGKRPIIERVIEVAKLHFAQNMPPQEAAAFLLARTVTRPDAVQVQLPLIISWSVENLSRFDGTNMTTLRQVHGILRSIANICKLGRRTELLPHANNLLDAILRMSTDSSKDILLCRLKTKVLQRIGLLFCPPLSTTWQYCRGFRSLQDNLELRLVGNDTKINPGSVNAIAYCCRNEDNLANGNAEFYNVDEAAEVIDSLISALRSPYTEVRWSAAKGIGRICARLPSSMVDDVLSAVLTLCTKLEPYNAWHGACLALAELGRRSLLLPSKLSEIIPVVLRALFFDDRSGDHKYGSNVRDAGCYVCWAFARAYHPKDFVDYVVPIATALVLVSLFDREVGVRRAGAAAFQENVGRQGQFPHGIEILTTCDYFSVGCRAQCYLELSVSVAKYQEYVKPMIDHLVTVRLGHWDNSIRYLAACALGNLCPFDPSYMIEKVLPELINGSLKSTLYNQHGCIFGTGELVYGLSSYTLSEANLFGIKQIVPTLINTNKFRGVSGELIRKATAHLIQKCSMAKLPFHDDPIVEVWREFLDDCVGNKNLEVQKAAVNAYPYFLSTYLYNHIGELKDDYKDLLYRNLLLHLNTNSESEVSGYLQIVGAAPSSLYCGHVADLLDTVIRACRPSSKTKFWVDSRESALKAIVDILKNLGSHHAEVNITLLKCIMPVLLHSLSDYTTNARGDVGSLVREVGMKCLESYIDFLLNSQYKDLITPDVIEEVMIGIAQQAVEKIDRTRGVAGEVFASLLHHDPPIDQIPNFEELKQIFPKSDCDDIIWRSPNLTFPRFTKLLDFPKYRYRLILGLIVSVGGLTELTVRYGTEALSKYLLDHELDQPFITEILEIVERILESFSQEERIILPLFKFLDFLLNDPIFSSAIDEKSPILLKLIENIWNEIKSTNNIQRIKAGIEVFGGMLQFDGPVRRKALSLMMFTLGFRYPVIRKATATELYECLMVYELCKPELSHQLSSILIETIWESELEVVRPIRNQVCDLLQVPFPKVLRENQNDQTTQSTVVSESSTTKVVVSDVPHVLP
ncbi:unnamed protein product [Heterobilharzia americana]|nr:unnamed protein product [Heterobilharzia americana]